MISLLRVFSFILFLTLVFTVALTLFFGGSSTRTPTPALTSLGFVLLLFTFPITAIYLILRRRMAALTHMAERAREEADRVAPIHFEESAEGGEVGELARAFEFLVGRLTHQRESLGQQKALLNEIVQGLGEGVIAINRARKIVLANRSASSLFNFTEQQILGRSHLEVIRTPALSHAFDRSLEGEDSATRLTFNTATGDREIEVRVFPMNASPDVAAVALIIDVTLLQKLERIRRDFLDDFSHEVRTPLAAIASAIEALELGPRSAAEEEQLKAILSRQVRRLERLVEDVAALNRLESGELIPRRERISIRTLLDGLRDDLTERAAAAGATITISGDDVLAEADPAMTQQIFSNLLDNAIKHGGDAVQIEGIVTASEQDAIVQIRDNGAGIDSDQHERIFHRFYRIDRSRSEKVPGVGLGLAITKHLVHLQGGSITLESAGGRGTIFEIRLPRGA